MKSKEVMIERITDKEFGYVFGLYLGDGNLNDDGHRHYRTTFSLNPKKDRDIEEYLISLVRRLGLNPYSIICNGSLDVRVNSKNLMHLIDYLALRFRKGILRDRRFQIGVISGLIDSDGYVSKRKDDIAITMKDLCILERSAEILKRLNVYTRVWSQKIRKFRGEETKIWRLRVGCTFKKLPHISVKLRRTVAKFN